MDRSLSYQSFLSIFKVLFMDLLIKLEKWLKQLNVKETKQNWKIVKSNTKQIMEFASLNNP